MMKLLSASRRAIAELERLHPPNTCLIPSHCPTASAIRDLQEAINNAVMENSTNGVR